MAPSQAILLGLCSAISDFLTGRIRAELSEGLWNNVRANRRIFLLLRSQLLRLHRMLTNDILKQAPH